MDIKNKIMLINIYTNDLSELRKYRDYFIKHGYYEDRYETNFAFVAEYHKKITDIADNNKYQVIVNLYYNMITFDISNGQKPDIIYMDESVPEYIRDYYHDVWGYNKFPKCRCYDNLNIIYLEQYFMRDVRFIYNQWMNKEN